MVKPANITPTNLSGKIAALEPQTPDQLHRFVRLALGLNVPRFPIVEGSTAPFDYLVHTFFEPTGRESDQTNSDAVVWANRGGGKTVLGAVATLLDLLFKPGIQVRILGGSMEQSIKMHEHLVQLLDRPWFRGLLKDEPTQRRVELRNGGRVQLLAGSQKSVRGVRVHKLRCDEVDEFDPDVWEAAQMVTRSGDCGGRYVNGAVEALSTMHRPFGPMSTIMQGRETQAAGAPRLFKWTAIDVIERCPDARPCEGCVLWDDCRGLAKRAGGFIPVDDLVRQWHRTGRRTWSAEMMCRQPQVSDCVYPEFETGRHVRDAVPDTEHGQWIGGMDFGLRSPTVMLWARVAKSDKPNDQRTVHIVDEYVRSGRTFQQNMLAIEMQAAAHGLRTADWLGVDPAGNQRNSHTGISDIQVLREKGYAVRSRASSLYNGIERIRCRLDHDTLLIHPRCVQLIEALQAYHFDISHPRRREPVKDGPDHPCDALRYMIVNLEAGCGKVTARDY